MPSRFWRASGNALLPGSNVLGPATGGLGPEIAVNGDFSVGTGWNLGSGVSISGGQAVISGGSGYGLWQANAGIVSGHTYRFVFTLSGYSAGGVICYVGSTGTLSTASRTANNTYSVDIVADSSNELGFGFSGGFTGNIDNVSVKEVL